MRSPALVGSRLDAEQRRHAQEPAACDERDSHDERDDAPDLRSEFHYSLTSVVSASASGPLDQTVRVGLGVDVHRDARGVRTASPPAVTLLGFASTNPGSSLKRLSQSGISGIAGLMAENWRVATRAPSSGTLDCAYCDVTSAASTLKDVIVDAGGQRGLHAVHVVLPVDLGGAADLQGGISERDLAHRLFDVGILEPLDSAAAWCAGSRPRGPRPTDGEVPGPADGSQHEHAG